MRKIIIYFVIGLVLLISGIVVTQIAGHKHMAKGMILIFAGFIISGAFGITLLQVRKQLSRKSKPEDILDQD
ncbi:hypothetical protein [Fluviicola sp.]|uniref:hypothetical protein n=1 Tax=Fluviicola sp. TaxID=1917219 RepID=UPI002606474A|nr:hypothetical protein [Fluviicola sp.]